MSIALRNIIFLATSYYLYFQLAPQFLVLLILITLYIYLIGLLICTSTKKLFWTTTGIISMLAILLYFKYLGFFIENITKVIPLDIPTMQLILPLGISFYIFQCIGYIVDVYTKTIPAEKNLLHLALFIGFFPKMLAGPIERPTNLIPQFRRHNRITVQALLDALFLVVWGAVLKFCIADNVAAFANAGFDAPDHHTFVLVPILAYTLQIFGDFAGYSYMAKGVAGFLGIELSWNFDRPYSATSPGDFWRRWHISLSQWFRDYLYIPLGGSKKGPKRTLINALITMTLVGFWHGATWMFIAWGAYHGLLICIYRLTASSPKTQWPMSLMFLLTCLGWTLFRSPSPEIAWQLLNAWLAVGWEKPLGIILLFWAPVWIMHKFQETSETQYALARKPLWLQSLFYVACFYALIFLPPIVSQELIYIAF